MFHQAQIGWDPERGFGSADQALQALDSLSFYFSIQIIILTVRYIRVSHMRTAGGATPNRWRPVSHRSSTTAHIRSDTHASWFTQHSSRNLFGKPPSLLGLCFVRWASPLYVPKLAAINARRSLGTGKSFVHSSRW